MDSKAQTNFTLGCGGARQRNFYDFQPSLEISAAGKIKIYFSSSRNESEWGAMRWLNCQKSKIKHFWVIFSLNKLSRIWETFSLKLSVEVFEEGDAMMKRLNDGTVMGGWWEISSIQLKSNQFWDFCKTKRKLFKFFICTIIMSHDLRWVSSSQWRNFFVLSI